MAKPKEDLYRKAPTHLYRKDGSSAFFKTQAEVDRAWATGWFGPPWLHHDIDKTTPLSQVTFETKQDLQNALDLDDRYEGYRINKKRTVDEINRRLIQFEVNKGIIDAPEGYVEDPDLDDDN